MQTKASFKQSSGTLLDTMPSVQKHDKESVFPLIRAQLNKTSYQFNTNVPTNERTNEKKRNDFDLKETSLDISLEVFS